MMVSVKMSKTSKIRSKTLKSFSNSRLELLLNLPGNPNGSKSFKTCSNNTRVGSQSRLLNSKPYAILISLAFHPRFLFSFISVGSPFGRWFTLSSFKKVKLLNLPDSVSLVILWFCFSVSISQSRIFFFFFSTYTLDCLLISNLIINQSI